jgi:hypothetical protein
MLEIGGSAIWPGDFFRRMACGDLFARTELLTV